MSAWAVVRVVLGAVMVTLGTIALLASIPAAVAATAIQETVGRQGVVSQPIGTLAAAPGDIAVIADGVSARLVPPAAPEWITGVLALAGTDTAALTDDLGEFLLVATPTSDEGIFVGVGPVEAVNDYLDGAPYSVAVRDAGAWPTISVPGAARVTPPAEAEWWSASATGAPAEIPAADLDGQTLVLMRPDAGAGPQAELRLDYRVAQAPTALRTSALTAAAAALGGLLLVILGAWVIVGLSRSSRPGRHAGAPAGGS